MERSKYVITMQYREMTEYTVKLDKNYPDFPEPDQILTHYEEDPKYVVNEAYYTEQGAMQITDTLDEFDTYREAQAYVLEMEAKDKEKKQNV